MIPLLALKEGVKVAERGIARLVAKVGKKPIVAGAAGFGAGAITTHEVEHKLTAPTALLWAGVALVGLALVYLIMRR